MEVINDTKIRIVFMGTPDFAVPSLKILVENGYNIVGVVTSTDKLGGRGGKKLLESAVKKYAVSQNLTVLQPKNLKSKKFVKELKALKADLQIIIAFRMLPEVVWDMPRLGTYNLHGSLLPKYRGAAPINWAVIKGETETGVTSFKLKHEIDTGDTLIAEKINIEKADTAGSLHDKMMELAADVILKTVKLVDQGKADLKSQNETLVTKAPKIYHKDCEIDFDQEGILIFNFIRGLSPHPTSWTTFREKKLKIFWAEFIQEEHTEKIGTTISDGKTFLHMYCKDGYIDIKDIQWEGRRRMTIDNFLNGLSS